MQYKWFVNIWTSILLYKIYNIAYYLFINNIITLYNNFPVNYK